MKSRVKFELYKDLDTKTLEVILATLDDVPGILPYRNWYNTQKTINGAKCLTDSVYDHLGYKKPRNKIKVPKFAGLIADKRGVYTAKSLDAYHKHKELTRLRNAEIRKNANSRQRAFKEAGYSLKTLSWVEKQIISTKFKLSVLGPKPQCCSGCRGYACNTQLKWEKTMTAKLRAQGAKSLVTRALKSHRKDEYDNVGALLLIGESVETYLAN